MSIVKFWGSKLVKCSVWFGGTVKSQPSVWMDLMLPFFFSFSFSSSFVLLFCDMEHLQRIKKKGEGRGIMRQEEEGRRQEEEGSRQGCSPPDRPFHNIIAYANEFYVVQKRLATDFEAPKLWKGRSGAGHSCLNKSMDAGRLCKASQRSTSLTLLLPNVEGPLIYKLFLSISTVRNILNKKSQLHGKLGLQELRTG